MLVILLFLLLWLLQGLCFSTLLARHGCRLSTHGLQKCLGNRPKFAVLRGGPAKPVFSAGCIMAIVNRSLTSQPQSSFSFSLSTTPTALLCNACIHQVKPTISFRFPNTSSQLSHRVISPLSSGTRIQASRTPMETTPPRSVPVQVAHELLQAGQRYLDVRTAEEFNAGHVEDAINVPYMFKDGEGMVKNPNFIQEVSALFSKDAEIVVGCQSGRRSLMAAKDLIACEFTGVTDVGGGYSAWVQSGLPVKRSTL